MSAEEYKAIMRRFWDVWEESNIDRFDVLLAPDYIHHNLTMPELPAGRDFPPPEA